MSAKHARVCDTSPCLTMQRLIERLFVKSQNPKHKDDLVVVALSNKKVQTEIWLNYCPFCGTRLDPKWLKRPRRILEKR